MNTLRRSLRHQRQSLLSNEREKFAQQLLQQVQQGINFQNARKIALYLENDGEINPIYIKKFLENKKISVYLPILDGKKLKFAKNNNKFKVNKFNINEPISTEILNAEQLDIIFMPLVGFDVYKNRLGMGGGFYDRSLNFKQQSEKPKLYGLAFDCQKVDKIETQKWDIPLDAIITPIKIYK